MVKKSFIRLMQGTSTSVLREAFGGGMSVSKLTAAGKVVEALNAVMSDEIQSRRHTTTPEASKKVIAGLAKIENEIKKHCQLRSSPSVNALLKILRELVLPEAKSTPANTKRKTRQRNEWSKAETNYLCKLGDSPATTWAEVVEKLNTKFNNSRSASSARQRYWRATYILGNG